MKNDNPDVVVPEVIPFESRARLCEWCHDPDRPLFDAEKHVRYHPECKDARTKQRNRAYYLANAEQLRRERRRVYRTQKAQRAASVATVKLADTGT